MSATRSAGDVIFGASSVWRSREAESFRSCVSSRCAATSFTFHFGARVCSSQSFGVSDRRSSINIPSRFGKRCAVKIGCKTPALPSILAVLFCRCLAPLLLLFLYFLIFVNRGRCGDLISIFEAQQAHTLCRAARLAKLMRVDANHLAVLGDNHDVGLFGDL